MSDAATAPRRSPTAPGPSASARSDAEARRGAWIMIAAMLLVPAMDACGKALALGAAPFGPSMPATEISFFRFALQCAFVAPAALWLNGWAALRPAGMGWLALRGVFLAMATVFFFSALAFLGLAESIAIFFVEPLLLTILSAVFLRERIGWRRITAVLIGLAGAMIIIRPNFFAVGWAAVLPLCAALCFASYLLVTKMTADRAPAMTAHLWSGVFGAATLAPLLVIGQVFEVELAAAGFGNLAPIWPSGAQWALIALLGLIAAVAHFMVIVAFSKAPASDLAPLQYFEIVSATALGWALFGDFPDAITWAGLAVIVASGLFVLHRERAAAPPGGAQAD